MLKKIVYVIWVLFIINFATTDPRTAIKLFIALLVFELASDKYKKMKNRDKSATRITSSNVVPFITPAPSSRAASNTTGLKHRNYAPYFDFPETDINGTKMLKLTDNVKLSGVTKVYAGVNPQIIIASLNIGEQVYFKRIPMDKYPHAILVVDRNHDPIGWIPEETWYQRDIAQRLDDGTTVMSRVSDILGGDNGKYYGVILDIARYERKRVARAKKNSLT